MSWTHIKKSYQRLNFNTKLKFPTEKIETGIQPNQHYHCKKIRWLVGLSPLWFAMCPYVNFANKDVDTDKRCGILTCNTNIFIICFSMACPGLQLYKCPTCPVILLPLSWHRFCDIWESPRSLDVTAHGVLMCLQIKTLQNLSSDSKSNGYLQSRDKSSLKVNNITLTATNSKNINLGHWGVLWWTYKSSQSSP